MYVGNHSAASNPSLLKKCGVTAIVNCTHAPNVLPMSLNKDVFTYLHFPICEWEISIDTTSDAAILSWFEPVFKLIETFTREGRSVLIHCLAGAHRAGTTGVATLMHFASMDVASATFAAKTCRPIIDPTIGR